MNTIDPLSLQRFVDAQEAVYAAVIAELRAGRKRTHWMWFVFPQHRALGASAAARFYGIASLAEARAYLDHELLRARLSQCCELVLAWQGRSAADIFGAPDDHKLRSSMTLFEAAAPGQPHFASVIDSHCGGQRDPRTLALIGPAPTAATAP